MGQGCLNGTKTVEEEVIGKKDSKNHHGIIFRTVNVFKDPSSFALFFPAEEKLITLNSKTLRIWDSKSFKCVETVKNFCEFIEEWEDNVILSCSNSSKMKFYNIRKAKPYIELQFQPISVEVENIKSIKKICPGKLVILHLDPEDKECEVASLVSVKDDKIMGTFQTKFTDCPTPILSRKSEEKLFSQYQVGEGRSRIGLIDLTKNNEIVNYFESHTGESSIRSMLSYMNEEKDEVLVCGGCSETNSLVYFYNTTILQNPGTLDTNFNLIRKIGIQDELNCLSLFDSHQPKYLSLGDTKGGLHIYEIDTKKRKFKRTFCNNICNGAIFSFLIQPGEVGLISVMCSESGMKLCDLENLPYSKSYETLRKKKNRGEGANRYFEQGENYFKKGDFENAITYFTMGIEISPVSEALVRRGYCYYSIKNFQDSVTDFKKALSLTPDNENILFNLGNSYFEAKKFEKSLVFFNKVIEMNPESEDVVFRRGLIYMNTKQYENAIVDFSRIVEEGIGGKEQVTESICYRGIAYLRLEEYDKATKDLEEAKKLGHPKADFHLEQIKKEIRKREMRKEYECTQYVMYPSDVELLYDEREERAVELFKDPHEYFKTAKEKKEKVIIKFEDDGDLYIGREKVMKDRIGDDGDIEKGVIWNEEGIVCIRYMEDFVDFKHFFLVIDRKVKGFNQRFRKFLSNS